MKNARIYLLVTLTLTSFAYSASLKGSLKNQISVLSRDINIQVDNETKNYSGINQVRLAQTKLSDGKIVKVARGQKILDLSAGYIFDEPENINKFIQDNNISIIVLHNEKKNISYDKCLINDGTSFYLTKNYKEIELVNKNYESQKKSLFKCDMSYPEDVSYKDVLDMSFEGIKKTRKILENEFKKYNVSDFTQIRDLIARRFINRPHWEAHLQKKDKEKNPRKVYLDQKARGRYQFRPWDNWQNSALTILPMVVDRLKQGKEVLDFELKKLNANSLKNVEDGKDDGTYRNKVKSPLADVFWVGSFTRNDISYIQKHEFKLSKLDTRSENNPESRLDYTNNVCANDLESKVGLGDLRVGNKYCTELYDFYESMKRNNFDNYEAIDKILLDIKEGNLVKNEFGKEVKQAFYKTCLPIIAIDDKKTSSHCGRVIYVREQFVRPRIKSLKESINTFTKQKQNDLDIIINFALDAQKDFVSIHPYKDGNGRTSRWVMDAITSTFDLPPLLLNNHNDDLTSDADKYFIQAKRGLLHSLYMAEYCLKQYQTLSFEAIKDSKCDVVTIAKQSHRKPMEKITKTMIKGYKKLK